MGLNLCIFASDIKRYCHPRTENMCVIGTKSYTTKLANMHMHAYPDVCARGECERWVTCTWNVNVRYGDVHVQVHRLHANSPLYTCSELRVREDATCSFHASTKTMAYTTTLWHWRLRMYVHVQHNPICCLLHLWMLVSYVLLDTQYKSSANCLFSQPI